MASRWTTWWGVWGRVLLAALVVGWATDSIRAAEPNTDKILIVVGPSTHPPGTHEVAAGARLMKHCLENPSNAKSLDVTLLEAWPADRRQLEGVGSIVFIGDLFPPERMENPEHVKAQLSRMMAAGCGIVCVHYATGLRKEHVAADGQHPLLDWLGGYFASGCPHHRSVARIVTATIEPDNADHPVSRGWKQFTFDDEPYWNNYFGRGGMSANVTSLAFTMLPPDAPKKETVAWAVERADGGRGVGIVMPHYFRNWQIDDLRTMILNSIYWSAKLDVPDEGIETELPDLATFRPASVTPKPRKKQ